MGRFKNQSTMPLLPGDHVSNVKMCDKCGRIFSELDEGWQAFTVSTRRKAENGQVRNEMVAMDACKDCSFQGAMEPTIKSVGTARTVVSE